MTISFDHAGVFNLLEGLNDYELDALDFGVIGFDTDTLVRRYNAYESQHSRLLPDHVLGRPFFTEVAQCTNNYRVAQRFEDALAEGSPLDETLEYTFSWRMRPTNVRLRLLSSPLCSTRYVLVNFLALG